MTYWELLATYDARIGAHGTRQDHGHRPPVLPRALLDNAIRAAIKNAVGDLPAVLPGEPGQAACRVHDSIGSGTDFATGERAMLFAFGSVRQAMTAAGAVRELLTLHNRLVSVEVQKRD